MEICKPETYRAAARAWADALQQAGVPEANLQAERLLWHV